MAYRFTTSGSNKDINYGDADGFDGIDKLTVAFRYYPTSQTNYDVLVTKSVDSNNGFQILTDAGKDESLFIGFRNGGGTGSKYKNAAFTLNAWSAVWIVYDGTQPTATDRGRAWVNGTEITAWDFSNDFPATIGANAGALCFGSQNSAGYYLTDGRLAGVGLFVGAAITNAGVIGAHADGQEPIHWAGLGLTHYMPLVRHANDIVGGLVGTVNGATVIDHPRIIVPRRRIIQLAPAGGGGTTYTLAASMDAAIQRALSGTASMDAAIQAPRTATASLDAAVQASWSAAYDSELRFLDAQLAVLLPKLSSRRASLSGRSATMAPMRPAAANRAAVLASITAM